MAYGRHGGPGRQRLQLSNDGDSCHRHSFSFPGKATGTRAEIWETIRLVDEFGGKHQADALRLRVRQNFAESLERRGVRMTDGHSFALFMGASQCQFELFVDRGYFGNV